MSYIDKYVFIDGDQQLTFFARTELPVLFELKSAYTVHISQTPNIYYLELVSKWFSNVEKFTYESDDDFADTWMNSFEAFVAFIGCGEYPYDFQDQNHPMAVRLQCFRNKFFRKANCNDVISKTFIIPLV